MSDEAKMFGTIIAGVLIVAVLIVAACLIYPQYGVYYQRLAGEAKLREAESSRQIAVEEAKAKLESSKMLADAEVQKAKGVAEANKIIGESLKDNPEYLTYLWLDKLDGTETIYVATEAGLPILEAGRIGQKRERKAVEQAKAAEKAKAGIAD
jgi:hypothetical protein